MLAGKKILLGITGSIAAYKCAILTRLLIKAGAEVQVIMTHSAADFIAPLTLSTLSKKPVLTGLTTESNWTNHVELGLWADLLIVAPATANTMAKMAHGICDSILLATYLSARCPVIVAPAMDVDMWHHATTRSNLQILQNIGVSVIPVGNGELASGLTGDGRMAEPEAIVDYLEQFSGTTQELAGKTALVTAGPTFEPIDPVRFIGNHSSGKMGVAIAESLARKGAKVHLILGPGHISTTVPGISTQKVQTSGEMFGAVSQHYPDCDIAVLAAAVADYRPVSVAASKIKKTEAKFNIELEKTIDIASSIGKIKKPGQINVGFALETDNELENAKSKLERKNLDFIVLNSLKDEGAGFEHDTNVVTFVDKDNNIKKYELMSKKEVAGNIVDKIIHLLNSKK